MIQVTVDKYKGYKVEGHALYAEPGKDIVCASVSVLSQSVLLQLQSMADIDYRYTDGLLVVRVVDTGRPKEVQALLDLLITGVSEIEKQYPDYVKLNFKEE